MERVSAGADGYPESANTDGTAPPNVGTLWYAYVDIHHVGVQIRNSNDKETRRERATAGDGPRVCLVRNDEREPNTDHDHDSFSTK